MNTALWITQGILGTMFLVIGVMKTFKPREKLKHWSWTTRSTIAKIRFVGISELLIGIGLILPELVQILPVLTVISAVSVGIIMILAIVEHLRNGENKDILMNIVVLLLSIFVASGRF